MKVWKIGLMLCVVLFLVACSNSDVGVIGGADGPTSVFIAK